MTYTQPEIGSWFENVDSSLLFEVVAVDELHNTIEVQYADGTLDEFDRQQWREMDLVPAAEPEDANAAYGLTVDDQSPDARGFSVPEDSNPLDRIEGESFEGTDES